MTPSQQPRDRLAVAGLRVTSPRLAVLEVLDAATGHVTAEEVRRAAVEVDNIAGSLSKVSLPGVVERSMEHFRAADQEYGDRIEAAVKELRA